jgi:hypothetical protein
MEGQLTGPGGLDDFRSAMSEDLRGLPDGPP